MPGTCPVLAPDSAFLSGMLTYVDCQAQAIGESGYHALAAPGSSVSLLLTGVLTLFVALFGYRMLLGELPGVRESVVAFVKIGVVLVLATSWPAFRTLAYDVALRGPANLAAEIGRPAAIPGAGGGLVARLQGIDNAIVELQFLGAGKPPGTQEKVEAAPTTAPTPEQLQQQYDSALQNRQIWDPEHDTSLLGQARTLYLTATIGAFASVRLVAGLLLALGPLFALFLLFDSTRGLFEGWVRGLAGAALGALGTAVVLGVELALLEPWLAAILADRHAKIATPGVPVELLVATLVFALTLLASLIAVARLAHGFRFPAILRALPAQLTSGLGDRDVRMRQTPSHAADATADPRSRAHAVADAVAASQRRETSAPSPVAAQFGQTSAAARNRDMPIPQPVPIGQSFRRRTRARVSAGANRRDSTI